MMLCIRGLCALALIILSVSANSPDCQPSHHQPQPPHGNPGHSEHTFTLAAKTIAPDGFRRSAALVNGQFPGPVLTANKGDSLTVNVVNRLADPSMLQSTSIHWHGIFQAHNTENDGPSFVTQCPISPGQNYAYKVELGDQAGTFWYHSHFRTQYVDGIRGALIIYDPHDPARHLYDVDNEDTIITLADWYHGKAEDLLSDWLTPDNVMEEPVPDSGLINGVGRFTGGPQVKLARINVVRGKRYRFRLISMSANGFFDFSISSHHMTVIEADGINHRPYAVDSINIAPGQRYSVVVNADQKPDNYWIRATQTVQGNQTSIAYQPHFNGNNTYAVFHYAGASSAEPRAAKPTKLPPGGIPFQEYKLVPLENPGSPGGESPPDLHVFNFSFALGININESVVWTVNNQSYRSPTTPTLLNILANGFTQTSQFAPSENTLVLPRDATIEINFSGMAGFAAGHAFHLHGHAFDVIQSAEGPLNFKNPPRRDVVISAETPVRVRFRTDNPGPWIVHCHIDWHLQTGLAVVFVEDPKGIQQGSQATKPNPEWNRLCSIYDNLKPSQQ